MDINNEQFITCLRSALHHLYEPDQLRRNPLTILFGLAGRVDASSALQKIFLAAIEELKPGDQGLDQSSGWQTYGVLFFRYVRGYAREDVANQLGISERQLSREQRTAIEVLALRLWQRYRLDAGQMDLTSAAPQRAAAPDPSNFPETVESPWIENLPAERPSAWKSVLLSVLDLLGSLIQQNEVAVNYEPEAHLPDLEVSLLALRHSLLNILSLIIPLAKQGELTLTPTVEGQMLAIKAEFSFPVHPVNLSVNPLQLHPNIEVARQLIERAGGKLTLTTGATKGEVFFSLPAILQIPVLVIDDNADTLQLFQRYAQGSRYAVSGVQQPAEALQMAERLHPRIIVMDVMMPELDGWDLLTQLRQDPWFHNTAIIVCSILPQEELARSLGANSFLQKPVLPQDFLKELDQQIGASLEKL
jgi:CheY-like chemotaxis protein/AraC-like DNA-binding protein